MEEVLMDYGLLGVMILSMITAIVYMAKRDEKRDSIILEVVKNNTEALTKFHESTKKCEVRS